MSTLEDRAVPVSQTNEPFKVCIYGRPGSRKTVFAAGFPNVLILDTERGKVSLLNHPELAHVKVFPVANYQEVDDIFWELKAGKFAWAETVVIDTVSTLQHKHLMEHLRAMKKKDRNRSEFLPIGGDYQLNTNTLRSLISRFCELDRNIVLICHELEKKDGENGPLFIRPSVTDKFLDTIVANMDVIGYMEKEVDSTGKVTKHSLRVEETRRIMAKSRLGFATGVINNPTAQHIIDAAKHRVPAGTIPTSLSGSEPQTTKPELETRLELPTESEKTSA